MVNHAPILGALFALALFVVSYFVAPDVMRKTAFVILVLSAIAGFIAQQTGEPAEDAIRGYPGVQRKLIHDHEETAEKATIIGVVMGIAGLAALTKWRRRPVPGGVSLAMIIGTAIFSGGMLYTGLLGGRVRHTEIRPGAVKADALMIEPPRQRPDAAQGGGGDPTP